MSFISQKVVKRLSFNSQKVVIHCFLIVSIEFQQNFLKDSERNFVSTQKSMVKLYLPKYQQIKTG